MRWASASPNPSGFCSDMMFPSFSPQSMLLWQQRAAVPEVPPELASVGQYPTEEQQQLLTEQSQQQQAFQEQVSVYNQVISFVIIGVAVALLAGSILWLREMPLIGEGVTLGAVFTLLYG